MAKRFIDTDIWKKRWWREQTPKQKLFYVYLLTNCDHAGVYDVDLELAEFQIGMSITAPDIDKLLKEHIQIIKDDKWFIKKFPAFQYGELNPNVKAHASVIKILTKYNLIKELANPLKRVKDKDKVKVKVKVKEKNMDLTKEVSDKQKSTLGYREVMFKNKVNEYADKYDKDMRIDFMNHYTEHDGKTMMWEKLKKRKGVFDIPRRLSIWKRKANEYGNKNKQATGFKMDSTGKFYIGYCAKCGENNSYSEFELKGDSKCHKAEVLPERRK